jgi:hypothetical protein
LGSPIIKTFAARVHIFAILDYKPGFSAPYNAPEIYDDVIDFSDKNDVYSIGVILYELFYNEYPFNLKK